MAQELRILANVLGILEHLTRLEDEPVVLERRVPVFVRERRGGDPLREMLTRRLEGLYGELDNHKDEIWSWRKDAIEAEIRKLERKLGLR